uniref:C2H2-type domain-containing protein n=1 Tax=Arion vulgaris TaxID=1028688 RepID=A0A0B7B0M5_9EUPU
MDYDSSSKFISSLAKFLQSLCNGYVEFDSGVQVIGHLYLSVDTGKTIDYVLNEKVCKTDENSVTFISNSFHAQPAEKPKPPGKRSTKDSEKTDLKNEDDSDNINAQGEPRSTNVGTVPSRSINQNSPHSQSSKRPYSPPHKQSQLKSGHASPKHKKSKTELIEQNTPSQLSNPASENSISSAPSPAADIGPSHSAQSSDALHGSQLGESYPQSFFHPDDENSLADESEERDIKPTIDTDVTFIKEEFAPSSSCSQSGSQSHDRPHGDDSSLYPYQSNQVFSPYAGSGGFGASQRSNFSSSGSAHMFSSNSGQGSSKIEGEGPVDPSAFVYRNSRTNVPPFRQAWYSSNQHRLSCEICHKKFVTTRDYIGHKNARHLNAKPYLCSFCGNGFAYKRSVDFHQKTGKCSAMTNVYK